MTGARMQHCRYDEVRARLALAHSELCRADPAPLAAAEVALVGARAGIDEMGATAQAERLAQDTSP